MLVFDITEPATYIPVIAGVVLPFLVALIAKQQASGWTKAILAALGAGLSALIVYLENPDHISWAGATSAFILAVVVAAASRKTLTDQAVDAVAAKTANSGIG